MKRYWLMCSQAAAEDGRELYRLIRSTLALAVGEAIFVNGVEWIVCMKP